MSSRAPIADVELAAVDAFAVLDAEIYEYHAELVADPARRALYKPAHAQRIMSGANVVVDGVHRGAAAHDDRAQHDRRRLRDVDVLVTPTVMRIADTMPRRPRERAADGEPR